MSTKNSKTWNATGRAIQLAMVDIGRTASTELNVTQRRRPRPNQPHSPRLDQPHSPRLDQPHSPRPNQPQGLCARSKPRRTELLCLNLFGSRVPAFVGKRALAGLGRERWRDKGGAAACAPRRRAKRQKRQRPPLSPPLHLRLSLCARSKPRRTEL